MAVIIDMEMPKSCDVCPYRKENEDIASDDPRHSYCSQPYMGEYVTDYIASRHPECPMEDAREYIAKAVKSMASATTNLPDEKKR